MNRPESAPAPMSLRDLPRHVENFLWRREDTRPPWQRRLLRLMRTLLVLGRDLALGQLTLRAMSLVYTTLLSIVPLLALSFSVLKAFGVTDQIEPLLMQLLQPLGDKGAEVAHRVMQFISNMNVGVLGSVGLATLLYTVVSLMQKIEEALNFIWHVPQPRRIGERFSRYLSVLLVGPILVFSALGVTASVMSIEVVRALMEIGTLGALVQGAARLVPYLLVIAAFTFVYVFIPNARVRVVPALVGGIVGGIAWQSAGWLFALFVASSGRYAAIYSSFAIIVLAMIWLYVSWLVLLFGASVAFYVQHPEYLYVGSGEPRLSNRAREQLALSLMQLVAERFVAGEPAPTQAEFTRGLKMPQHVLRSVVEALESHRLIVASGEDPPRHLLARDPSAITVSQVLEAIRSAGEGDFNWPDVLPPAVPAVRRVVDEMQAAVDGSVGRLSLRELVDEAPR